MARPKDDEKHQAICRATVAEVIESGLGGASVARIAKRAGVAPGTIYLYFANKEQLLQGVYLDIKRGFHAQMMAAVAPNATLGDNIRAMWLTMVSAMTERPKDFFFVEYVGVAQLLGEEQRQEVQNMAAEVSQLLEAAMADGTLAKMPLPVLQAVLVAPASYLARQHAASGVPLNPAHVKETLDRAWSAISAGAPAQS